MNNKNGWYGVSFPFRIGTNGGIAMSGTTMHNPQHIEESIVQILSTIKGERTMRHELGCEIDTRIFDPNDEGTHGLIKYDIIQALNKQETRIYPVKETDIKFNNSTENTISVTVQYTIKNYGINQSVTVELN